MAVYSDSPSVRTSGATVTSLNLRDTNCTWKNLESFDDLHETVNCCGSVRLQWRLLTKSIGQNKKLKYGETETRVSCNLTAMAWKDKYNVNILMNKLFVPTEGKFYYELGKSLNPPILGGSNRHMG